MMIAFIQRRIILIFQFLAGICKKALCCIKRRRRNSCEPSPLTTIGVVADGDVVETQTWGVWEDPSMQKKQSNPIEDQIRMYREQRYSHQQSKEEEQPNEDFFLDMTPRITKQKKILIQNNSAEAVNNMNLSLAADPVFSPSELGVWEESQTWEAEGDEDLDVSDFLREQKRQDRERRIMEQQRRKMERGRPTLLTEAS